MRRLVLASTLLLLALAPAARAFVPDDPGPAGTPGGWAQTQWNFAGPFGVGAPQAWDNLIRAGRPGGRGVTVAVLDTGLAYKRTGRFHRSPDIDVRRVVPGPDFVGHDSLPLDANGHGTHVASTIAEQTDNGVGLTGLAYGVTLMPVRVLDDAGGGDVDVVARGVRWAADHGAQVINLSLELDVDTPAGQLRFLRRAIAHATAEGALVVAAAGNEGFAELDQPARMPGVLAVGATTERGCLSQFSSTGRGLDVVAPGGGDDALLDDPHCLADSPGDRDIAQVTLAGPRHDHFGIPDGYEGTSMAAPHVSAIAALVIASGVLGRHPTPKALTRRIEQTARDLGEPGYDTRYGFGLVDAAATAGAIKSSGR